MNKKINVLHITNILSLGGGTRAIATFCKYSDKTKFKMHVCAIQKADNRIESIKKYATLFVANSDLTKINNYICKNHIDVIHFHRSGEFESLHFDILTNFKGVKIETNVFGKYDYKMYEVFDCHLFKSYFSMFSRYVAKSGKTQKEMNGKVAYIPNPIDIIEYSKFSHSKQSIFEIKKSLGITKDDFVVGKLGSRPAIEKWSDTQIEFLDYLPKSFPLKLLIQGIPESRVKKITKKYKGRVIEIPQFDDDARLMNLYDLLDVSVHITKLGESFGYSISEALVRKKPVIVNSTPRKDNAQLEQVQNFYTGLVASHPKKIAQAVLYFKKHRDEIRRMGENGNKFIEKNFEARLITKKLEDLYFYFLYGNKFNHPECLKLGVHYTNYLDIYSVGFFEYGFLNLKDNIFDMLKLPERIFIKFRDYAYYKFKK